MKAYLEKHYRVFGFLGALVALIIAASYIKVIPEEEVVASGIQEMVLRYGHTLCWILLSQASLLWGINKTNKWSKLLTYTALATYIIFMVVLLASRFNIP